MVCCSNNTPEKMHWSLPDTKIDIDATKEVMTIDSDFFGVCPMFWQETDKYMADGKVEGYLKEMKCKFLRFPGGTESDNYIWQTNTLHNTNRWPNVQGGDEAMDIDEFMSLCNRLGAEPILCVNTEIGIIENEYQKAVDLAVSWVQYCKDKGYGVTYWEIGNEPYYHYRFSASEYARLFVRMAKAMKEVDPNIKVAAVGEWNYQSKGKKDRVNPANWNLAGDMEWSVETQDGQYSSSQLSNLANYSKGSVWWNEVLKIAGNEIDIASIHWYYNLDELENMKSLLDSLTALFEPYQKNEKEIELFMTEWTLHESIETYGMERALTVAEAIGKSLDGKVRKATYWPLRCSGTHDKKGLLDMTDEKNSHANYDVMKLFAQHIGTVRIPSNGETELYHFSTKTEDGKIQVFLVNRTSKTVENTVNFNVEIKPKGKSWLLEAGDDKSNDKPLLVEENFTCEGTSFNVELPPYSLGVFVVETSL